MELVEAGAFGDFLEATPAFAVRRREPTRLIRAHDARDFEAGYRRIELPIEGPGPSSDARLLRASFFAGRPGAPSSFSFHCPPASAVRARWWAYAPEDADPEGGSLALRAGSWRLRAPPPARGRLALFEAVLPDDFCHGSARSSLEVTAPAGAEILVSPPALLVPTASPRPPVILISVDTLRADHLEERDPQPAGLRSFFHDALRFNRAYSSFPTTSPSHSVMFSGALPEEIGTRPLEQVTFATALRDASYATLGFVAGGYARAVFGFDGRRPGFALGFDLYLEGLHEPRHRAGGGALPPPTSHYTLGASLERSLRWWSENPDDPAFHFVHGFDVHSYRMAPRRFWEESVAERVASGTRPLQIASCADRAGIEIGEELVVHNPGKRGGAFRGQPLGALEECHRLLTSLLYDARVRSVEQMLARYFDGLREIGVYDPALIVLTSDHGESLLDEPTRDGRPWWGHGRALHNILHVPLLVKLPGERGRGRDVERMVGLVDLRATIGEVLGIDAGASRGTPLVAPEATERAHPIFFSGPGEAGAVLADATLCSWRGGIEQLRVFRGGSWAAANAQDARACDAARARARAPLTTQKPPAIPSELREELRALGYAQ